MNAKKIADIDVFAAILQNPEHPSFELVKQYQDSTVQELRARLDTLKIIPCGKRHEFERTDFRDCPHRGTNINCGHGKRVYAEDDPKGGALDFLDDASDLATLAGFPAAPVAVEPTWVNLGLLQRPARGQALPESISQEELTTNAFNQLNTTDSGAEQKAQSLRAKAYVRAGKADANGLALRDMNANGLPMTTTLDSLEARGRDEAKNAIRKEEHEIGEVLMGPVRATRGRYDSWLASI